MGAVKGRPRIPQEHRDAMVAAYLNGASCEKAAALYGYSFMTCLNVLKEQGVPRRTIGVRQYSLDETFFETIDSELKAYWLGMLTTDGYVYASGYGLKFVLALQRRDRDHLELLAKAIKYARPITDHVTTPSLSPDRKYTIPPCQSSRLTVNSNKMVRDLIHLGVHQGKSFTVRPWVGDKSLMRHYWRGCIDGDGCISYNRGNREWNVGFCGNEYMVRGFADFASEVCGTRAKPKKRVGLTIWNVGICGRQMPQRLVDALYSDATVALQRKNERAKLLLSS